MWQSTPNTVSTSGQWALGIPVLRWRDKPPTMYYNFRRVGQLSIFFNPGQLGCAYKSKTEIEEALSSILSSFTNFCLKKLTHEVSSFMAQVTRRLLKLFKKNGFENSFCKKHFVKCIFRPLKNLHIITPKLPKFSKQWRSCSWVC